jgi:hypothetical protein
VWALSPLHSHSHYWLCYLGNTRVTATQIWYQSVVSSFIQPGFILQSFFLHSYFTFFSARFLSSLDLNPPSELPIMKLIKVLQFWRWRKLKCPEETTGTWSAPKIPFIRCNIYSAARWDRTHTPHRHWLQACKSDTADAPWTTRPPRTPFSSGRKTS